MRKATHRAVIREVTTRASSDNLSILRSFQSSVAGKRKMTNDEISSNDILAWPDIWFSKPL